MYCILLSCLIVDCTTIGNVYRPPDSSVDGTVKIIEDQISDLIGNSNPDMVVLGDMNVNYGKITADSRKIKQFAHRMALTQLITKPTCLTNTTQSIIDHIYTNNENFYCQSGVIDVGLSNHCLVYTSRKRLKTKQPITYIIGRSYQNFDEALFYLDISRETWINVYSCSDSDIAAETFTNTILNIAELHAPHKRIKVRSRQAKWVTSKFLSLVDEKNHICNIFRKNPTAQNALCRQMAIRSVAHMK